MIYYIKVNKMYLQDIMTCYRDSDNEFIEHLEFTSKKHLALAIDDELKACYLRDKIECVLRIDAIVEGGEEDE